MKKIDWEKYNINRDNEKETGRFDDDDDEIGRLPTIVQTPFGIFKLNDTLNPFNRFNFWIANTNFNISNQTKDIMDDMNGVEVFMVISRYQFIVGIAKLFDENSVKQKIEKVLCGEKNKLKDMLNSTYKYWILYQFPNMNLDYFGSNDVKEVLERYKFYVEAKNISSGKIFKSATLTE